MKLKTMNCLLVCIAIAGITSTAIAVVEFGVVGDGTYVQFGPLDLAGNNLGVGSETYDAWVANAGIFPGIGIGGTNRTVDGRNGSVMLALNPYTSEVWTDVPAEHRAYTSTTYTGQQALSRKMASSGVPDDTETGDINESLVLSGIPDDINTSGFNERYLGSAPVTNYIEASVADYSNDVIFITGETTQYSWGWDFGAWVNISPDGGLLGTYDWTPEPVDGAPPIAVAHPQNAGPGTAVAVNGNNDFANTRTYGYNGYAGGWGYTGQSGTSAERIFGFEMDNIAGWIKLGFSGHRTGVRLMEYYFDYGFAPGDVNEDGVINAEDIDLMGEYILTGIAPTTGNYDLSDDGVTGGTNGAIDINDLDYLVRHLVETSAVNGDGDPIFGTQYGDFNLDGEIELGDLTRLGTYYGVGSTWAEGNANPHLDTDIELGDLTILGTYYGVSNGGVDAIPEPMTMSLLAVGAVALLRRRKS